MQSQSTIGTQFKREVRMHQRSDARLRCLLLLVSAGAVIHNGLRFPEAV